MGGFLRRRNIMAERNPWTMLAHNGFTSYGKHIDTSKGGNVYEVISDDEAEVVSNGKNSNNSQFYFNNRFLYNDIKDKLCRLTWTIECDGDASSFDGTTSAGNITIGLYTMQSNTGDFTSIRKSKADISTFSNYVGHHSVEFVPSELFAGQVVANYLGWNVGFRSSINGLTIRYLQLDFEVHE